MMLQLVPERGFSRLNTLMCTRKFCNKALLVPKRCHDVATLGTGSKTASTWSNTQRGLFLDRLRLNGLIRAEGRIGMKLVRRGVEFKLNHAKDIRFSKFSESLIVLSCLILSLVVLSCFREIVHVILCTVRKNRRSFCFRITHAHWSTTLGSASRRTNMIRTWVPTAARSSSHFWRTSPKKWEMIPNVFDGGKVSEESISARLLSCLKSKWIFKFQVRKKKVSYSFLNVSCTIWKTVSR